MNVDDNAVGYSSSGAPKISKKAKSELQVEGTPAPKRKRKQIVDDTNIGIPSKAPNQSQESPLDQAGARPVKRTKIAPSTANTKEARKPERNGNREAIPSPETPVIANITETGKVHRQSMGMQPVTVVVHTNGTSPKKPKKSKAKTTQQEEEKEVSALPQSPAETKTVSMDSADPSLADSSTDQRDLADTSAARGPRKGKKDKMIGFFAPSEVRALETFKLKFCNENGISSERFDRMVQHVDRRKDSGWPIDENIIKKPDFWQLIYDVLPSRDRRSVYRFMKRHFQDSSQKPHHWTHEQDGELIELVTQYGPKFAHIAKMLGRVEDDVVQRWKNRLEHRSTMRRGAWSEDEVRGLLNALQDSWNKLKKDGQNVGRDIYEMDEGLISWGTVSNKLQNWRSRQQCADKWRKVRRKIMGKRSTGNQDAVYDPAWDAKPQGRAKSITLAEQIEMERVLFKSSEYVDSEDGDEEDVEQSAGTETQSPKVKDERESAEENPTIMAAPEKPATTPAKALNKVSQSNESQSDTDDDSESEASSNSAESASDDASEAESKSGSGSGSDSDSDSESSVESDAQLDARMSAQSSKGQEKDVRNNKASSAKTSKPTKPTSKASEPSKSTIKEEETPQATSSESGSESDSSSDSGSDSSSDSEAESTSSSEEPSNRQPTEVAPKAPTSIRKASVKGQVSQKTQNSNESEKSSSTSDETSSDGDSTEDSESDDGSDSDSSASDDRPVQSPKTAALEGTKRKAQEPAEQTGKSASKRLKTSQKPNKKSSSPSSSDSSSSEDSESEDESDSDSEADTDESSSASNSSDSTSKPQPKSKSESKQPTAQPKLPKAVTGQSFELSKSRTPAISKEGSNAKNGQSGPKQKSKQVKPSLPQVKKDGEKEKGKLGSTALSKGKKSK
ncbi:hypothetical protein CNMCM6106_000864 [Aspergillus hiratsukae]|uniref:MYB DNA-binding domain protein n=1 Tax=Aspergillus hiratsukae TaxID=1194566 RepID=A0A8H6Q1H7_9EURO|nr:hypothetical protein CNMCM6106_000864 [Aspergillus hiratsukae]